MKASAGIKVDKGLVPLPNSNGESWCQGLDGLAQRTAEYYKAGARFAKWRAVVSIPAGPSQIALRDAAYGLARYAAISQVSLATKRARSTDLLRARTIVSCCNLLEDLYAHKPSTCGRPVRSAGVCFCLCAA